MSSAIRLLPGAVVVIDGVDVTVLFHVDPVARAAATLRHLSRRLVCRMRGHRGNPCSSCGQGPATRSTSIAIPVGRELLVVSNDFTPEEENPWDV